MLLSVRSIFSMVQQFCPNYRLLLELHALTQVAHSYPLLLPLTAVILVSKLHSMTHYYNTTVIYCGLLWYVRLLVNLTQPAYLCFGSEYPKKKDVETMKCFLEVNHYLRQYKEVRSPYYFIG